ncbi:MAG: Trk family potassium uptake protein [Clostridiales bacterium]|nr:Trk family potassium uptake protein [Clostridiales bacterium]
MKLKVRRKMSVWRYLALGYLLVIFVGSILLVLPFATRDGHSTSYIDALFTSASATCVTGLAVYDTGIYWSFFGQIVILLLVQVGGLGFTTFVTTLFMMVRRGVLGLSEKRAVMQSYGGKMTGVGKLVIRIVVGTFTLELIGACFLSIRFIQDYGAKWGIYYAVFHAVSAFCNAGFDLFGNRGFFSLTNYAGDPIVSLTIPLLVIVGGLGFCVWGDIFDCKFRWKKYQFYTKLILVVNSIVLFGSMFLFLGFEWNASFSEFGVGKKILCAFFDASTSRTAGFCTTDLTQLSNSGYLLTLILMFIGGCSGSTAGGIKISTFAIIVIGMFATLRGKRDINIGKRRIDHSLLAQALAIFMAYLNILLIGTMLVCAFEPDIDFQVLFFEVVSATGTVGLSLGCTPLLGVASKILIILLMYMGRVGVLTLAFALRKKRTEGQVRRPLVETLYIG